MTKVVLDDVSAGFGSSAVINNNSAIIEAAFDNTLSRDGASPNQMQSILDMNSFRIINLGGPINLDDAARLRDVNGGALIVPGLQGGTVGQVLTKDTTTDYDYSWQTPTTAGGGLFAGRATIGSDGTLLISDGIASSVRNAEGTYALDIDPSFFVGYAVASIVLFVTIPGPGPAVYALSDPIGTPTFEITLRLQSTDALVDRGFAVLAVPFE